MTLSKVSKQATPMVYWFGAQYYLNNMGSGAKIVIIDHDNHFPVRTSHVLQWMVDYGDAVAEHRRQGPAPASGTAEWERQNTHQAQGMSHSEKSPAAATGKPYVVCSNFHARKCGGWTSLEALSTNPFRQCGTPFIIARKTIKFWE
eukprot:9854111-Karenia_brevis.AAC.1